MHVDQRDSRFDTVYMAMGCMIFVGRSISNVRKTHFLAKAVGESIGANGTTAEWVKRQMLILLCFRHREWDDYFVLGT
jgi:hypothetical protein